MAIDLNSTAPTTPISDDQALAKALAGIADEPASSDSAPAADVTPVSTPIATPVEVETPAKPETTEAPAETPASTAAATSPVPAATSGQSDLENIRKTALNELRPLIDHVELPAEEKFDTYLMLIRSTDDAALVGPAHAAAQAITDEKRRAEALLDVVKEIDFLTHKEG